MLLACGRESSSFLCAASISPSTQQIRHGQAGWGERVRGPSLHRFGASVSPGGRAFQLNQSVDIHLSHLDTCHVRKGCFMHWGTSVAKKTPEDSKTSH